MMSWRQRTSQQLTDLTGDLRQLASVRRITLDDGPERGVRALAFSTGGGLDFWVLTDRCMDIGPLRWQGMPVSWEHPSGFVSAAYTSLHSDADTGIGRAISGYLVTCGLENVRRPSNGSPLHGSLPLTPARIIRHGEDWKAETPVLFAEGESVMAHLSGSSFRLTRRIQAPIGGNRFSLTDRVENIGPEPAEMKILYHFNLGFPLVGQGTRVVLNRREHFRLDELGGEQTHLCGVSGSGGGRTEVRVERPEGDGLPAQSIVILSKSEPLPFLQIWNDPRLRRNILAIEPTNCDRSDDGTSLSGTVLEPGETWNSTQTHIFDEQLERSQEK